MKPRISALLAVLLLASPMMEQPVEARDACDQAEPPTPCRARTGWVSRMFCKLFPPTECAPPVPPPPPPPPAPPPPPPPE